MRQLKNRCVFVTCPSPPVTSSRKRYLTGQIRHILSTTWVEQLPEHLATRQPYVTEHSANDTSYESGRRKMGPTGCPETSVMNYHYSLRNNPEERSSLVLCLFHHTTHVTNIHQRFTCTAVQVTMPAARNLQFLLHSFPAPHIQLISTAVLASLHFCVQIIT
jgi:hypothetical protein